MHKQSHSKILLLLSTYVVLNLTACSILKQQADSIEPPAESIESPEIRIAAVGDIMLGGNARGHLEQLGYDYPFEKTQHILQQADIAIANLETSLTHHGQLLVEKKYRFRNDPEKVPAALNKAGIDVVSLANNHSLDYGYQGLNDTFAALTKHNIKYHGAGLNIGEARQPLIIQHSSGQQIAFLAYNNTYPEEFWATETKPGIPFGHEKHVRADVADLANKNIDIIVVSFHWGQERKTDLRAYQPQLAHAAIDAGADLVIGHHPHILQAVESYKHGLILYSLGNFTFSTYSNKVHSSAIAEVVFKEGRYHHLVMTPLNINNFQVQLQPQILVQHAANKVYQELSALSEIRNTSLKFEDDKIVHHCCSRPDEDKLNATD